MHATPLPLFWRLPWLKPLNDTTAWNNLLQTLNGTWSLTEVRARVVLRVQECRDMVSLYLKPNRLFKGFCAGQYLSLTLPCNGVLTSRNFSISNAPSKKGLIRLTFRVKNDGRLTPLASALKKGDTVRLSQAGGDFGATDPTRGKLLLAAGSGITPMMAMLQQWAAQTIRPNVVLLYSARTPEQAVFRDELQTLVHHWPELRVHTHLSAAEGRLNAEELAQRVPDFAERETLLCGPESFMETFAAFYRQQGLEAHLKQEHFQARKTVLQPDATQFAVFNAEGQSAFNALQGQNLLEAAESDGLSPTHGCRRGICMSCQCKKLSGVVINQLTQTASDAGEAWIQLCVSTPASDLHLEI